MVDEGTNGTNGSAALKAAQPQRATIALGDEADLEWYFGPGQSAFERSTFGAMLEACERASFTTTKCARCDGDGVLDVGSLSVAKWCPACGGTGYRERRARHDRGPVTAQPTAEDKGGRGYTPTEHALERYAAVSRRLDRVESQHVEVLAAYYGDTGARWGRTRHGRVFAVYALTPAGHKLVRMAMLGSGTDGVHLSASERIGVQAELEKTQPKQQRRALLDAADRQARELVDAASVAWGKSWRGRR